ncbi:Laminin subunit beta-1 [Echinococcus granulosus]|nr:Laminin subunit beta-1 [Echinococcus granulosus]
MSLSASDVVEVLLILLLSTHVTTAYEDNYSCRNTICSPRAGDLLIGRDNALVASSTCGLENVDTYCVVTASGKSHCSECYSKQAYNSITNPNSHRVENVISRVPSDPGRWWQSENALHNVTLTLNLETQFQFISTILRFKTFRPAAMYLERSVDFAQTWQPYAYFSNNCPRDFPSIPERPRRSLRDVTCTSIYSQLTPSEGGVVAFMAAPSEMHANLPPYSEERQNLTAITNLRVTFTRLNTLGDMNLDNSSAIRRKYYYAMYEWNVWGRCSCFGHATHCKPKSSSEFRNLEKVYGVCECTHNTAGENCEKCASFYQNKPWRPASRHSANACERCECNDHSDQCYFNPILYLQSGNVSGGHCYQCLHNTEGPQCEFCSAGFYRHPGYPINHSQTCQPCNCHAGGSEAHENCDQYTNPAEGKVAGQCVCKTNVGGDKCDRCRVGYWNFRAEDPDGCEECKCHMLGTLENIGCDQITGACTCKRFVEGEFCDRCMPGYFNLTASPQGCQPCACSPLGSIGPECDPDRGICKCKTNFSGRDCSQVDDGYYVRYPQLIIDQPSRPLEIPVEEPKKDGNYVFIIEIESKHFGRGDRWIVTVDVKQEGSPCRNVPTRVEINSDTRKLVVPSVCMTGDRKTIVAIMPEAREGSPYTEIVIGNIIFKPDDGEVGSVAEYCESYRELSERILNGEVDPSRMPQQCQTYFNIPESHWKETSALAIPCECNVTGSVGPICDKLTGQCLCRPGVVGRKCDQCDLYHYHFSTSGCTACNCHPKGSVSLQCNSLTSQCSCRPGIEGRKCDICGSGHWNFPYCQPCECNGKAEECDQVTGACIDCRDNTGGPRCESCAQGFYGDPLRDVQCRPCECPGGGVDHSEGCQIHPVTGMQCHCQIGYTGLKCSECAPNYYGNPTEFGGSCQPCDCSGNLPPEGGCDQVTGACLNCLHNTEGEKCDRCISGYWGNASQQACQPCSCYYLGTVDGVNAVCDRNTGACSCLPNVLGPRCFECAPQHFNLTSGHGCEPCNCDPTGSLYLDCHSLTGQCTCKPDRGGRKCDQCQRTFYGDPRLPDGCKSCDCDRSGSLSDTCDPVSGQCICREGIAGRRCDRCDRGTTGILPHCQTCGECWTNWDNTITAIVDELHRLQNQTSSQLPSDLKPVHNILQSLVEQLELIPASNLTDNHLKKLADVLQLIEGRVIALESADGVNGKFPKTVEALINLQKQQDLLTRSVKDNEVYLQQLSNDLEKMIKNSKTISFQDPYGAYNSLMKAEEEAQKIEALQRSLENRRTALEALLQKVTMVVNERGEADEEFKRAIKLMDERIKDLQDEIRQINRVICGDNQRVPESGADLKTCPSSCGGASCDPITAGIFDLIEQHGTRVAGRLRVSLGLVSNCAGTTGCSMSFEGRLKELLADHLAAQNGLSSVLQRSAKVENLIAAVNASRTDAENLLEALYAQQETLEARIIRMQNITNTLIEEGQEALRKYAEITLEYHNELVQRILSLKHDVTLQEALEAGNSLQQLSSQLSSKVDRILTETAEESQSAKLLRERAKNVREKARSFLEQMNKLANVSEIYDELEKSKTFSSLEDAEHQKYEENVKEALNRLEMGRQGLSQEVSTQADQAAQNAVDTQRLLEETEISRQESQSSMQNLQVLNTSFGLLEEKLNGLNEAMERMANQNGGGTADDGDSTDIEDPGELAKQVNIYIEKLEADLMEIEAMSQPLVYVEKEIGDLTEKLENVVKEFKTLGSKISPNTKHQLFCS